MAAPLPDNVTELQKPSASVVMVSPDMAERWLDKNTVNRNLRNSKVAQYARDMRNGNWQLTGEAIKFDQAGRLVDGQHRCWAVIESGCTVGMFVVRNISRDAQCVMDSGSARTAADNLSMEGMKNTTTVAAIARRRMAGIKGNPTSVTNSEVYAYVDAHPEIEQAAHIAQRFARYCDLAPSTVGLAAWLIADVHNFDAAEEFFCAAAEKVGLHFGDAALAMTQFFATERRNRRTLSLEAQLSVIIRAFNYRHAGKPWRSVRVISPGVNGGLIPIPEVAP